MDNLIIDKEDFYFLLESKLSTSLVESINKNAIIKFGNVHLQISKKDIEEILDYVGNELSTKGFDENDEPNGYGLRLELLIDKLSKIFYNS